jgi:hypothetical protein
MTTPELRQSLIDLQVAALEKVAQRQGLLANRPQLVRLIEDAGIAGAMDALRQQTRAHPSSAQPRLSIFQRLAQRWFGRN